jgi:hypothetical protein
MVNYDRAPGDVGLKPTWKENRCLLGRPLTRDDERRVAARASGHQVDSGSPRVLRRDTILNSVQFVALFVSGMLGGIAAVFIAYFGL